MTNIGNVIKKIKSEASNVSKNSGYRRGMSRALEWLLEIETTIGAGAEEKIVESTETDRERTYQHSVRVNRLYNQIDADNDQISRLNEEIKVFRDQLDLVRSICTSEHERVVTGSTQDDQLALLILSEIGIGDAMMQEDE